MYNFSLFLFFFFNFEHSNMQKLGMKFYWLYIISTSFTHKYAHGINKLTKSKESWNSSTKMMLCSN